MVGGLKEKKEIEDLFKKAQKPWAKQFEKVSKTRSDYHSACKSERSAQNQERNAGGDSSLSPDQVILIPAFLFIRCYSNSLHMNRLEGYY